MIYFLNIFKKNTYSFRRLLHNLLNINSSGQHVGDGGQQANDDAPAQRQRQHRVRHEYDEQHVPYLVLRLLETYALAA